MCEVRFIQNSFTHEIIESYDSWSFIYKIFIIHMNNSSLYN